MREFLAVTKALSDRSRLRALMALRAGEMCVCQIIEMLHLAPSTVSKHMSILYHARLVESRKEGRWVYYRVPDEPPPAARAAIEWAGETLASDQQIRADARAAKAVRRMDKDKLCSKYDRP